MQDWLVRRELKQVPGIIDITTFGGTARQYQAEMEDLCGRYESLTPRQRQVMAEVTFRLRCNCRGTNLLKSPPQLT